MAASTTPVTCASARSTRRSPARFKVYIIDEAHMVTRQGFNALLKLVEEPPPHLKFIFATTEPEKVIATIRSRTHHYPFRLVPPAALRRAAGGHPAQRGRQLRARRAAAGGPGRGGLGPRLAVRARPAGGGVGRGGADLRAGRRPARLHRRRPCWTRSPTRSPRATARRCSARSTGSSRPATIRAGSPPTCWTGFRDLIVLAAVPDAGETGLLDAPADRLERMARQAERFGQRQPDPRGRDRQRRPGPRCGARPRRGCCSS